jgi:hypothetical protein
VKTTLALRSPGPRCSLSHPPHLGYVAEQCGGPYSSAARLKAPVHSKIKIPQSVLELLRQPGVFAKAARKWNAFSPVFFVHFLLPNLGVPGPRKTMWARNRSTVMKESCRSEAPGSTPHGALHLTYGACTMKTQQPVDELGEHWVIRRTLAPQEAPGSIENYR